ncbi:hypothetical protein BH23GEM11_BH23GEM11_18440 [soil metagenome]
MKAWTRYLGMAAGVTVVALLMALVLLEGSARLGLLWAAGVALVVQLGAFAFLVRFRARPHGFLAVWLGGSLVRLLGLGAMAVAVVRRDDLDPLWSLLGLAGLFFILHLLEPVALRGAGLESGTGTESG